MNGWNIERTENGIDATRKWDDGLYFYTSFSKESPHYETVALMLEVSELAHQEAVKLHAKEEV